MPGCPPLIADLIGYNLTILEQHHAKLLCKKTGQTLPVLYHRIVCCANTNKNQKQQNHQSISKKILSNRNNEDMPSYSTFSPNVITFNLSFFSVTMLIADSCPMPVKRGFHLLLFPSCWKLLVTFFISALMIR